VLLAVSSTDKIDKVTKPLEESPALTTPPVWNPAPPKFIVTLSVNPDFTDSISAVAGVSKPPAIIETGSPTL